MNLYIRNIQEHIQEYPLVYCAHVLGKMEYAYSSLSLPVKYSYKN